MIEKFKNVDLNKINYLETILKLPSICLNSLIIQKLLKNLRKKA